MLPRCRCLPYRLWFLQRAHRCYCDGQSRQFCCFPPAFPHETPCSYHYPGSTIDIPHNQSTIRLNLVFNTVCRDKVMRCTCSLAFSQIALAKFVKVITITREWLWFALAEYRQSRPFDNIFRPTFVVYTGYQSSIDALSYKFTHSRSSHCRVRLCTLVRMPSRWSAATRAQQADLHLYPLALHLNM